MKERVYCIFSCPKQLLKSGCLSVGWSTCWSVLDFCEKVNVTRAHEYQILTVITEVTVVKVLTEVTEVTIVTVVTEI